MRNELLEQRLPSRRPDTVDAYRDAVSRVLGVCRERLAEDLDLDDLAEVAHMSPYHFHRTFRQTTGLTPAQFLAALRMEEARRRLVETDQSVTDISLAVGYHSLGTFTHRFSALVGLAPTELRERAAELADVPLGELAAPALELFQSLMASPGGLGPSLAGRVVSDPEEPVELDDCMIFLGCFDRPVPERLPVGWALRAGAGSFQIVAPVEGTVRLLVVALPAAVSAREVLVEPRVIRGVGLSSPLDLDAAEPPGDVEIRLRPLDPLDPPVLLAIPLLVGVAAETLEPAETAQSERSDSGTTSLS